MATRVVLVTGVSRYLGAHVAARLAADERIERVLGVDTTPPNGERKAILAGAGDRFEFVRADIRNPFISKIISAARVDTVAHLSVVASPGDAGGRASMKEHNVIGTMQLLAACQNTPSLRKLVVRSSVAAYGASPRDPAIFTEDTEPRVPPRGGYGKDIVEIEGYVRGLRRRRQDAQVTVLRFAPFIGPRAETALTRYFSLPVVPTVLGYDPRIQFVHIDDALEVIYQALTNDHPGVFNVAGPGVLLLSQAIRRAGRIAIPVLRGALSAGAALGKATGLGDLSLDQLEFLVHGRVVDATRLRKGFGYTPRSTRDAFDDFVRGHDLASVLSPDNLLAVEHQLLAGMRELRGTR